MFANWRGILAAGAVGAVLTFAMGIRIGSDSAQRSCARDHERVKVAAGKLIDEQIALRRVIEVERDQARSEVDKVNASTARQFKALQATLMADKQSRAEAALRLENAAKIAAEEARETIERAREAREVIANASDACSGASVPSDVRVVLDAILRNP
jgi:hypothetical protein